MDGRLPLLLALGALLTMGGCATGAESRPARLFETYMRDVGAHDLDAAMGHLAPDMQAEFSPEYIIGREEMRQVLTFDFAVNSRTRYSVVEETDDAVEVALVENNDLLNLLGVYDMQVRLRVEFRDRQVTRQTMLGLSFTGPTMDEAMEPFLAWARAQAPEQYALIHGEAGPVYTGDTAPVWLTLAQQWKNAGAP